MKNNKITFTILTAACLLTACVEKYEPVSKTERSEEMYRVWNESFTEFNTCYISSLFWLDAMLQLTQQERDSMLQHDFLPEEEVLKIYPDGTCEIKWGHLFGDDYGNYTMNSRMLVKTDGNTLESIGTKWEIILNLPSDFVYLNDNNITNARMKLPADKQEIGLVNYPEYLPFNIECIGHETWQLKDVENAQNTNAFSLNYTMQLLTPGNHVEIFMSDKVLFNGNGRMLAKTGVTLDYQMNDYVLERNTRGIEGTLQLQATQNQSGTKVNAHIACHKAGYEVTYRGVITQHNY